MNKADMFAKVETVRLEISPGYFINVNPKSINPTKNRIKLNRTKNHDIERHRVFSDAFRAQSKKSMYSSLILDEAVALSIKKGVKYAVRKTGVKYWSIVQRKRKLKMAGMYKPMLGPGTKSRYTMEQKQRCVSLALQLMADPATKVVKMLNQKTRVVPKWSQIGAFIEAGRRLGMNGMSIEHMYHNGMIT